MPEDASAYPTPPPGRPHAVIVGAGIGGLAAALRLSGAGIRVTVLDRAAGPGGKMRTAETDIGPVDIGPTVLTMREVFDDLFASVGASLADHVTLDPEPVLARHFWRDGTVLDLVPDPEQSGVNVARVFGAAAAEDYLRYARLTRSLFEGFDAPMMQAAAPSLTKVAAHVLRNPRLLPRMSGHLTLAQALRKQFREPRLAQLFARYATYVGGLPQQAPALLGLIAHSEQRGVWRVRGGMHGLARAIAGLAERHGAVFRFGTEVTGIETEAGRARAVRTAKGAIPADIVLFNGDPRALTTGQLGEKLRSCVPESSVKRRSLSANVLGFAARASGLPLAAHNVLFATDPGREYLPLAHGRPQTDPTLYICAEDRFGARVPDGPERFEIIMNAPPVADGHQHSTEEREACLTLILARLAAFGLRFDPAPTQANLTMPADFAALFPASSGSLYGRSPRGMMAAFQRPQARTKVRGLYLTGGGAHPGAGVPMATLSARHAAEAIMADLGLTFVSRRPDMPGGMSTGSAMTEPAPSR